MSTDVYRYKLTEKAGSQVIWILLNDAPGPAWFNDWNEGSPISGCLTINAGRLSTQSDGQYCRGPGGGMGTDVLVLRGASWSTRPHQTGDGELIIYENSSSDYTWELIDITVK